MAILLYFKVLPTDPRYQNLNLIQKFVLLSAIDKDLFDKLEIAKGFFDQIKFYINPEIYKAEKEASESSDKFPKNVEFEKQGEIQRKYGVSGSSDMMKEAISDFYKDKNKEVQKFCMDDSTTYEIPSFDDEDTLG